MNKLAVVTGGFGGIGYAVVKELDALGYGIVILSRTAESEENQAKLAALTTDRKMAINCDVTVAEQVESAIFTVVKDYGNIDILVNCAGWTQPVVHTNLDDLSDMLFDKIVVSNLRSVFTVVRAVNPFLNNDSVIVNIGSASAARRGGSSLAYTASKAGVESLTRNLAVALAPKTRVVVVSPGFVDTGFNSNANKYLAISSTPMGRVATPEDVADAVVCAINNKFMTGNMIVVDGGRSI